MPNLIPSLVLGDGSDGGGLGHALSVLAFLRAERPLNAPSPLLGNGPALLWLELPHLPQRFPARARYKCPRPIQRFHPVHDLELVTQENIKIRGFLLL